jgi:hypothetical protein
MSHLLNVTVAPRLMRTERLWPNTDWPTVWKHIQATPAPDTLKAQWYNAIHALIPTNERLHKIHLSPTDQCRLCNQMYTLSHRLTDCGEGRMMWLWTRRRKATILRLDERNIPEEWLIRSDFRIWPPKRNCAVLWFLIHLVVYRTKQDPSLTMNDYLDFMRRSKWKLDTRANRTSLVGNYLQVLGTWHCERKCNWDSLSVEWIKQAPVIAICEDSVAYLTGVVSYISKSLVCQG